MGVLRSRRSRRMLTPAESAQGLVLACLRDHLCHGAQMTVERFSDNPKYPGIAGWVISRGTGKCKRYYAEEDAFSFWVKNVGDAHLFRFEETQMKRFVLISTRTTPSHLCPRVRFSSMRAT